VTSEETCKRHERKVRRNIVSEINGDKRRVTEKGLREGKVKTDKTKREETRETKETKRRERVENSEDG